jgi:hypothetical protein
MAVQSNLAGDARGWPTDRTGRATTTLDEGGHVLTILLIIIVLLLLFGGGWGYSRRGRRI